MNDHELETTLRSVHMDPARSADAESVVRDVMSYPYHETRQQRHWLPRPTWRFQSMFSATKFVVAGVVVALFGGFVLAGMLTQPIVDTVPAVATDAAGQDEEATASVVTGQLIAHYYLQSAGPENLSGPDDGFVERLLVCDPDPVVEGDSAGRLEMSDARLSGVITICRDVVSWGAETPSLYGGTVRIENDGGAWEGTHFVSHLHLGEGADTVDVGGPVLMQLAGSGDYDGLSAVLNVYWGPVDWDPQGFGQPVAGVIFTGDSPYSMSTEPVQARSEGS